MKKVLILGAGMVSKPIVDYLLERDFFVTLADRDVQRAEKIIAGQKNGSPILWQVEEVDVLSSLVSSHDIVVSLLPYAYHLLVAKECIKHKKNMVTTSYVKQEMRDLDAEARKAGIIILNEVGLDPGIDHMTAMRIIEKVHSENGQIESFYSLCGALPAPETSNNPFRYKFSWSPKGVVMAGNNDAQFMKDGTIVNVPTANLFKNPLSTEFPGVGILEVYPNRDSIPYINLYGIPEVKTIYRGTFRQKGWCEALDAIKALNLITNDTYNIKDMTYADFVAMLIGETDSKNIKAKAAKYLGIPKNSDALHAIEWLGLFDDKPINRISDTPFEITSDLMIDKMLISPDERDMIVMQHVFLVSYPEGRKEVIKSRLIDYGNPQKDTAVARTVALPAAIGVELILNKKINIKGVHIPVLNEIYEPILNQLADVGIEMIEEFGLPLSENF